MDYKTGSLNSSDMTLSKWEDLTTNAKKNALNQVLTYAYFLKNDLPLGNKPQELALVKEFILNDSCPFKT